jgi:pimeloyl-ACP methyl ester carboxylesterase
MVQDLPTRPSKPIIIVVPGAACPSKPFYQPLCDTLTTTHGYTASTADLPSASRSPPQQAATLEDDAVVFHEKIAAAVENGEDVVVVAHSYGGMVATDATRGFAKADRDAQGLPGGVVRIVYLSCIVAGVGETAGEVCEKAGLAFKMEAVGEVRVTKSPKSKSNQSQTQKTKSLPVTARRIPSPNSRRIRLRAQSLLRPPRLRRLALAISHASTIGNLLHGKVRVRRVRAYSHHIYRVH